MNKLQTIIYFLFLTAHFLFSQALSSIDTDPVKILVIAGQSNAINIHADAADLEKTLIDTTIRFYYHCGMPPDRDVSFFSTSDNKWTTLAIQRQIPYVGHNEYFFGPEISLVNSLGKTYNSMSVIKCAYGGSNLAVDWEPNVINGNMLYETMMKQIENACAILDSEGISYSFAGFFWIQGEADALNESYAEAYYENLKEFIEKVRTDLNSPDLPFIISRLPSEQPYTYLDLVRSAQEKAAEDIEKTKWVNTDSLELDKDKIHFISTGVQKLGYLMAESFLSTITSTKDLHDLPVTGNFVLGQNYPNPFNPSTTISFSLPITETIVIKVFNILGKEVSILMNEELQPGNYKLKFNAENFSSGVYFYSMSSGSFSEIKKMQVLK